MLSRQVYDISYIGAQFACEMGVYDYTKVASHHDFDAPSYNILIRYETTTDAYCTTIEQQYGVQSYAGVSVTHYECPGMQSPGYGMTTHQTERSQVLGGTIFKEADSGIMFTPYDYVGDIFPYRDLLTLNGKCSRIRF